MLGVDAFYEGFGKAYLVPFPFTVVFVYDENYQTRVLKEKDDIERIKEQDTNEETQRMRQVRYKLRALHGNMVHFEHHETRSVSKSRGSGENKETYTLSVNFTFTNGRLSVGRNDNATRTLPSGHVFQAASGFNVSVHYTDGTGVDSEGDRHSASTTIGHAKLGINREYLMTADLARLLDGNEGTWQENLAAV